MQYQWNKKQGIKGGCPEIYEGGQQGEEESPRAGLQIKKTPLDARFLSS